MGAATGRRISIYRKESGMAKQRGGGVHSTGGRQGGVGGGGGGRVEEQRRRVHVLLPHMQSSTSTSTITDTTTTAITASTVMVGMGAAASSFLLSLPPPLPLPLPPLRHPDTFHPHPPHCPQPLPYEYPYCNPYGIHSQIPHHMPHHVPHHMLGPYASTSGSSGVVDHSTSVRHGMCMSWQEASDSINWDVDGEDFRELVAALGNEEDGRDSRGRDRDEEGEVAGGGGGGESRRDVRQRRLSVSDETESNDDWSLLRSLSDIDTLLSPFSPLSHLSSLSAQPAAAAATTASTNAAFPFARDVWCNDDDDDDLDMSDMDEVCAWLSDQPSTLPPVHRFTSSEVLV